MDWKTMLAYVTGSVEEELLRRNEYLVAENEGHGFANEDNSLAMFAKIEHFLATHLGGRYQPVMSPEIQERLEELTVDPSTVVVRVE